MQYFLSFINSLKTLKHHIRNTRKLITMQNQLAEKQISNSTFKDWNIRVTMTLRGMRLLQQLMIPWSYTSASMQLEYIKATEGNNLPLRAAGFTVLPRSTHPRFYMIKNKGGSIGRARVNSTIRNLCDRSCFCTEYSGGQRT